MDFGNRLTGWYRNNKRDLPWRDTTDPYKIWLSEVILQQTRVEQGLDYYHKFVERFPDVYSLANANPDEVFKMWQGLGYYNRAANMMEAAKTVVTNYNGRFPEEKDELLRIKGIGPYTAAAIASLAFRKKEAVVDGNVFRVLSRYTGTATPINTTTARKAFEKLALQLMDGQEPDEFNQAIMEFGALFCKPRNPACHECIFRSDCSAYNKKRVDKLPVKKPKVPVKHRYFYYLVMETATNDKRFFFLKKRDSRDIWRHLYDFYLIEKTVPTDPMQLLDEPFFRSLAKQGKPKVLNISVEYQHQLTHQRIHARFIRLFVDKKIFVPEQNRLILVGLNELINYPVPRLIERYLEEQALIKG